MEFWIPLLLGVGLLAALDLLWTRPGPVRPDGSPPTALDVTAGSGPAAGQRPQVEFGLFSPAFVRQRLDALAAELDRLDQDPDVFAKAFHTLAARAAYQALQADAADLTRESRAPVGPVQVQVPDLIADLEAEHPVSGRREVLDL